METMRQQKFARLIQKELSQVFVKEGTAFFGKSFVTITNVRATQDLSIVRVYLSILGTKDREGVMETIRNAVKEIRGALGVKIKHSVRHIPQLEFFLDDSLDYAENIERLLKEVKRDSLPE